MSRRRLIVTGDDFGAAPEVNAGIVRAHREGILTSASLMVTGDAAAEAAALARANPRLAVGLHLVLAQGRAAAPRDAVPHLVRADGTFGDAPIPTALGYAWRAVTRRGRAELRREVEAQLDAFAATGLRLAHVDGHLNIHLHPMILPLLLELAPRYGIRAVRLSREDLVAALRHDRRHLVRKVLEGYVFRGLAAWAAPRLRAAGIATADRVYGMHQTGHVDEAYVRALVRALPPGASELYCHPATAQAPCMAAYQRGYDHAVEVAALTSARVRAELDAAGVELVSYSDLAA
ncbi:MAG TPA: hopanoid biosynthesis-associated protein HpnK [Candidatus Binatia bacterium]|jgi:hopanoid biosynthesis associated protein HpnK|nr:hopanoid biosynthesis-associated protein HpnK [Candidatus Binatia bacterium]